MDLYTGHISYHRSDAMDITVKSGSKIGLVFAPTWGMVHGYKDGSITQDKYTTMYRILMRQSYKFNKEIWESVLEMREVTFTCYCKSGDFCHRLLLAGYFVKLGANYHGERN